MYNLFNFFRKRWPLSLRAVGREQASGESDLARAVVVVGGNVGGRDGRADTVVEQAARARDRVKAVLCRRNQAPIDKTRDAPRKCAYYFF
jgi:hypothetical protein